MKKLFLFLLLSALILSACGTVADNPDGYYNVTLRSGGYITCQGIEWVGEYLHCDSRSPLHFTKVQAVLFVYEGK